MVHHGLTTVRQKKYCKLQSCSDEKSLFLSARGTVRVTLFEMRRVPSSARNKGGVMKRLFLMLSLLFLLTNGNGCGESGTGMPDLAGMPDMAGMPDLAMAPTITLVTPGGGPVSGGTDVTITGTNFDASAQMMTVRFGNNAATVKSASATQVVATTPPGALGTVDVVVTNGSTSLSATLTGGFTYQVSALTLIAGGLGGPGNTDGTGAAARFNLPFGVAVDGAGNLYVADSNNHTIRKVVVATGVVTTLAGTAGMSGSTDGTGAAARFNNPYGVAVDGAGNLYVTDRTNHTIRKVVVATGVVTTLAGTAGMSGSTDDTGAAARFNNPSGVAVDGAGNLYVADSNNGTIRKIVVATSSVTTIVGAAGRLSNQPGPLPASLNDPTAVAALPTGELFLTGARESVVLGVR